MKRWSLAAKENERKRQSVENLEAVIRTLEEDETKAKAQMESWQSVKDEKNASHKAFFEEAGSAVRQDFTSGQRVLPSEKSDREAGRAQGISDFLYVE